MALLSAIRVAELCAGAGAMGLGVKRVLPQARTVVYVEVEAYAAATLVARMQEGRLDEAPIWSDLRTFDARPWRGAVDLVMGGYPCFAAGTYVLTADGYRSIESVAVGDLVLTHLGRWRRVSATMSRDGASLRRLDAGGVPGIITTDDHPFWFRGLGRKWNNTRRQYDRRLDAPEWRGSAELRPGSVFLGQILPPEKEDPHPIEFWWVVGRYLADGWRQKSPSQRNRGRVNICCARREADDLEQRIRSAGFSPYRSEERTTTRFSITRNDFYNFLAPFGTGADGKRIPGFALELDHARARALLDGYHSGDGYTERSGEKRITTISKSLALGAALLAQRAYGVVAGIRLNKVPSSKIIEGRRVSQRPFYTVSIPVRNRSAIVDGVCGWKLLRRNIPCGTGRVFNIAVEEDESYVADGAIVHNCQPFSQAGKRRGADDPRHLWPHIARILRECKPPLAFFENVPGHVSLGLRDVRCDLEEMGYRVEACLVRAEEVGAPHRRERLFVLAYAKGHPLLSRREARRLVSGAEHGRSAVAHAPRDGLRGRRWPVEAELAVGGEFPPGPGELVAWRDYLDRWPGAEPAIRRGAPGTANRLDRLSLLGNLNPPAQYAYALRILLDRIRMTPPIPHREGGE